MLKKGHRYSDDQQGKVLYSEYADNDAQDHAIVLPLYLCVIVSVNHFICVLLYLCIIVSVQSPSDNWPQFVIRSLITCLC